MKYYVYRETPFVRFVPREHLETRVASHFVSINFQCNIVLITVYNMSLILNFATHPDGLYWTTI